MDHDDPIAHPLDVTGVVRRQQQRHAVALRLGRLGASVTVNFSRDETGAAEVVGAIEALGSRAIAVKADVSKPAEVQALFAAVKGAFGRIDIAVANAGIDEPGGSVVDVTEEAYDRMFGVNAKGAFFTLQQAARQLESGGSIVSIGSSSTLTPTAGFGLYSSSKLPASFLVKVLAQEVGSRDITVNAVIATATDAAGYFSSDDDPNQIRRLVEHASPLGARMGSVDDIADAVELFTSPLTRWISGQQLLVSGGAPS